MAGEDVFREGLIRRLGFTIKEVRAGEGQGTAGWAGQQLGASL